MQGGEDRDVEPGHEFEDLDLIANVEMIGGLVQNEVIRSLRDRSGDEDSLLLAAREGVEASIDQVLAADPLNGPEHDRPVRLVVTVEGALVGSAPDHHHFEHGEVEFDGGLLGDDGHTARHVFGPHGQQIGAVEEHLTGRMVGGPGRWP